MTLKVGHVPGAAGSGTEFRRGTLAAQTPKADWRCSNGHDCKGAWLRCLEPGCNEKRGPMSYDGRAVVFVETD